MKAKVRQFSFLMFLCAVLTTAFTGCEKDDNDNGSSGYAPKSVSGKTMNFDDLSISFSSNNSCSVIITYSPYYSVTSTPGCNYKKTSGNTATLELTVPYRFYLYGVEIIDTYRYQTTLYFIGPNEGYASGTRNGKSFSDYSFTIF